jgi:hypothetical protein
MSGKALRPILAPSIKGNKEEKPKIFSRAIFKCYQCIKIHISALSQISYDRQFALPAGLSERQQKFEQ